MKSMLLEASTVEKAIEEAWNEVGKPAEFTIKILDAGKKGFFWFKKSPAIISITYDPRKLATAHSKDQKRKQSRTFPEKKQSQKKHVGQKQPFEAKKTNTTNNKKASTSQKPTI